MATHKLPAHANVVTALVVKDFMRIREVALRDLADVNVVELRGANAQGKSSLLRAAWSALGGKAESPERPVRDGEQRASARVELGELIVERTWRPDGTSKLELFNAEGATYKRPQQILDALTSRIAFDPVAFLRYDKGSQAKLLRELAGIDTEEAEAELSEALRARRDQNALCDTLKKRLGEEPPAVDRLPAEELHAELAARHDAERRAAVAESRFVQLGKALDDLRADAAKVDEEIHRLQASRQVIVERIEAQLDERDEQLEREKRIEAELEALRDEDAIGADLARVREVEAQAAAHDAWRGRAGDLVAEQAKQEDLKRRVDNARETLAAALRSAAYPIEGLSVTGSGVHFGGRPLEQASTSEQLRVSMAMAMALNPDLRVVHVKEGSLLDRAGLQLVADMAAAKGYQVWIEIVDDGGDRGVVIEDGRVKVKEGAK